GLQLYSLRWSLSHLTIENILPTTSVISTRLQSAFVEFVNLVKARQTHEHHSTTVREGFFMTGHNNAAVIYGLSWIHLKESPDDALPEDCNYIL
ncbi:7135_t:CDS:1, partial [Gigaspora rosea]